ncbi:hypothetical protein [Roseibium aggregatum]|uniref:Uncharacterized protein n=1 Tax=Roseibium aggregatum TaxID=187304 RepID=A0A0M6YAW4_9HYPH|nr:hypothetical protein [Roseibium aggregatum]CTQ47236.1 hypothetical protein LAL4801_05698 [Roseibium aggregatum]
MNSFNEDAIDLREKVERMLSFNSQQKAVLDRYMATGAVAPDDPIVWMIAFASKNEWSSAELSRRLEELPEKLTAILEEAATNALADKTAAVVALLEEVKSLLSAEAAKAPSPAPVLAIEEKSDTTSTAEGPKPFSVIDGIDDDADDLLAIDLDAFAADGTELAAALAGTQQKKTAVAAAPSPTDIPPPDHFEAIVDAIEAIKDTLESIAAGTSDLQGAVEHLSKTGKRVQGDIQDTGIAVVKQITKSTSGITEGVAKAIQTMPDRIAQETAIAVTPIIQELGDAYKNRLARAEVRKMVTVSVSAVAAIIVVLFLSVAGGFYFGQRTLSADANQWERVAGTDEGQLLLRMADNNDIVNAWNQCTGQRSFVYMNTRACNLPIYMDAPPLGLSPDQRFQIDPFTWAKTKFPFWVSLLFCFGLGGFVSWLTFGRKHNSY